MSERQSTLRDEHIDPLSAMVVDLRAQLAALESSNAAFQRNADDWRERALQAEAERDVLRNALVDWITADDTDVFNAADERLSKLARRFAAAKK